MSERSAWEIQFDEVEAGVVPPGQKPAICRVTSQLCAERWGGMLRAIVLTGSLAREEATFVNQGGRWRLLGDAEFLLVFKEDNVLPPTPSINGLEREIERHLMQGGLSGHVELSPVHTRYLRTMPPEIFAFELRTYGQVVWGERQILWLIPAFSASDIPLEDGWRMLCNRVVEFLEVIDWAVEKPVDPSPDGGYRMIKLYLDMATSFLLLQGAYAPTYHERADRLRALVRSREVEGREVQGCGYPFPLRGFAARSREVESQGVESREVEGSRYPFPLRDFAERVVYCTKLKLQAGRGVDAYSGENGFESMFSWAELVTYVRGLWRWELERLVSQPCVAPPFRACPEGGESAAYRSKARHNELSRFSDQELMRRWMQLQPIRQRLRGWASALRRCGWRRSWQHWPHWVKLGWRGSPRYWVYAAACELFFRLPGIVNGDDSSPEVESELRRIRSWLPVPGDLPGIGGNLGWREVAADIAWNYRAFLKTTRS
jgi:hypothetical protein